MWLLWEICRFYPAAQPVRNIPIEKTVKTWAAASFSAGLAAHLQAKHLFRAARLGSLQLEVQLNIASGRMTTSRSSSALKLIDFDEHIVGILKIIMFLTFKTWCSHLLSRKRVSRMVIITSNKTQYLVVFLHNLDVDWIPSIFSPRSCRRSSRKCGSSRRAFARWQTRPAAPAARRDIFLSKFRKLCKFL